MRILRLAGRRLAASIPTLFLILIGIFLLLQFAPGDTVDAMMAQMGGGDAATARELRKFYGLDLSVPVQLGHYLWRLVRLDLGFSSIYGKPVAAVLLERLPPTILLITASLSFAFFFGLLFGVIAARGVNKWPDTLNLDYVRTARAKGLDETRIVTRHVLRNALLPMVTLIGLQAGTMLGGSVVVESVFSLPGLGRLAYESVVQRDLNTLLGIVFVSALLVITVNFIVDLIYARLDPRIVAEA